MSNPDLPGPYWQDQDEPGHGSGWHAGPGGPQQDESPWDDVGFWRSDRTPGKDEREPGQGRRPGGQYQAEQESARHSRRAGRARAAGGTAAADDAAWPMPRGRARRGSEPEADWEAGGPPERGRQGSGARAADRDHGDWTGRFSQTADDLRNRLGMRGSAVSRDRDLARSRAAEQDGPGRDGAAGGRAASRGGSGRRPGRPEDDFWGEPAARRPGGPPARPGASGARAGASPSRADGDGLAGPRGPRRGAAYANGGGDGPGRRTALREQPGDIWGDDATDRGLRSRVAERTGIGRGGGTGGGGTGGGRGGRRPGEDPRSRGERFKDWLRSGSWWRHWTWKKALALVGAGIAAVILLGIAGFFILYEKTPIPLASEVAADQSSTVYYANNKQMGTFDTTIGGLSIDRILLTPNQIPRRMTLAMTAAEDRHFYSEGGVSLTGLVRAAAEDVLGSGNLQGGSTITMQYAKNYYNGVDTGRNASTKLKEIFIAMKLGREESKSWVMTNYLNTVPFGTTIDGLGAAAESYFDINLTKPGATLSVSQAAMLAAMPNRPGVFSPDPAAGIGYKLLVARWKLVLANMVRDGNISQQVASKQVFPAYNPPPAGNGETGPTGYLMNMVDQQLEAPKADGGYGLTEAEINTGGYKITTTFSPAKMTALARSISEEKAQIREAALQSGTEPLQKYDRIGSVLENSRTGAIVAVYGGPGWGARDCRQSDCYINMAEEAEPVGSSFKPYVLSTAVSLGMNVFTSKLNGYSPIWIPDSPADTNSTEIALSPTSPPPGISGLTSGESTNGIYYYLFNEQDENSSAPLPVNVAAAISSDPAFEDLAHRDGIQSVINMARSFGVGQTAFVEPCGASSSSGTVAATIAACNDMTGPGFKVGRSWYPGNGLYSNFSPASDDPGGKAAGTLGSPAIALGENPLTPIEQASTFATLADDGVYHTPHVIQSLQQGTTTIPSNVKTRHVLTAGEAADVDWALSFDNQLPQGTAYGNVPFDRGDVIGKTGTLGSGANASQAWFIGATPDQYAMSVALFTNDPGTQNLDNLPYAGGTQGSQGGGWPATIWNAFMTKEFSSASYVPLFTTVNNASFQTWIQAHPKKKAKPVCKPGQFQGCTCPKGAQYCAHPNPTPTCQPGFGGQPCGGGTPSPSPSCQPGFGGQPCGGGTPSPSPTPSVSCTPSPGAPCIAATDARTASSSRSSPASGRQPSRSPGSATTVVVQPAEDAAAVTAARARLVT